MRTAKEHLEMADKLLVSVDPDLKDPRDLAPVLALVTARVQRAQAHIALAEAILLGQWVEQQTPAVVVEGGGNAKDR